MSEIMYRPKTHQILPSLLCFEAAYDIIPEITISSSRRFFFPPFPSKMLIWLCRRRLDRFGLWMMQWSLTLHIDSLLLNFPSVDAKCAQWGECFPVSSWDVPNEGNWLWRAHTQCLGVCVCLVSHLLKINKSPERPIFNVCLHFLIKHSVYTPN